MLAPGYRYSPMLWLVLKVKLYLATHICCNLVIKRETHNWDHTPTNEQKPTQNHMYLHKHTQSDTFT